MSLLLAAALVCITADYPQADLLIEAEQLSASTDRHLVLDARPRDDYDRAHIPGAIWVDHAEWSQEFQDGSDADAWSQRIGQLGIEPTSSVVIYDDSLAKDAARIWWILRYWGVENAKLLNGGWRAWHALELPTEDTAREPAPVAFRAQAAAHRLATKEQILASLAAGQLQIVDARSEDEHCGIARLSNRRAGAIPGARHLEWTDLLDKSSGRFLPASELTRLFQQAGIELDRPTAAHCQSGGRSAVMTFGMELMGAPRVANYYRSFGEWSADDSTPIELGQPRQNR